MLIPGERGEIFAIVQPEDTVRALDFEGADQLPDVLATSRIIALVELAAARAMRRLLRDDQVSLGMETTVAHGEVTAIGSQVFAAIRFDSHRDGLLRFCFEIYDEAGLIARGEHARSIVGSGQLADRARARQLWAERDAA
jgi:fluoroacetyl-CoA thioesterase